MLKAPVTIDTLMKEWSEDSTIDSTSMEKELLKISHLHGKYLNIMSHHRHLVRKMETDYKVMKGLREDYYQGHLTQDELEERGWEPMQHVLSNPQIARKLDTDKELNKLLLKRIAHEEILIRFRNSRSWDLKTYVEYLKYIKG